MVPDLPAARVLQVTRRESLEWLGGMGLLTLVGCRSQGTREDEGDVLPTHAEDRHRQFMGRVVDIARREQEKGRLPFATIVVNAQGEIISEGINTVDLTHDPSDHAEMQAMRRACARLGRSHLQDHDVYAISHPCPMCLTALMLAKPRGLYYGLTIAEKDSLLTKLNGGVDYYRELQKPGERRVLPSKVVSSAKTAVANLFREWNAAR